MSAHGSVGVFGKIPAQGDFLRINVSDRAAPEFIRWLEEGNELLEKTGAQLASAPIGFVFPSSGRLLVGAVGRGVDAVGRTFPFAIFASLQDRDLTEAFPLVPDLYRAFFEGACALLADAPNLASTQIADRLRHLQLPGSSDLAAAQSAARDAGAERVRELLQRLFGDAEGGEHYAFWTFEVACQKVRGRDPGRVNVALDCPCARESDAWVWLELARRVLRWPAPPPFFWRNGTDSALVLSLGSPPPAVLAFFSSPPQPSQKIWPLRTQLPSAVAAARKALSAAHLSAIERPDTTVADLVASLSHW